VGCLAHARRKFFDLQAANQSQIAQSALQQLARIYEIEREVRSSAPSSWQSGRRERSRSWTPCING
jgi:lipopolysaccharide biosynthesis regulator YciM